ncbi:peptidase U32 family protein [Cohnella fermenti]
MRTELLAAAGSIGQMERYIEAGATAVLIGEPRFAMRLPGAIPQEAIADAIAKAHRAGAKAYVSMNKLFRNHELPALPGYLKLLAEAEADAVVFGDPAVLLNVREHAPGLPLHWNAEMTGTNSATAGYWGRRGATRAVLARELNEEEIADLKSKTTMQVQVQAHGMTNIYFSQRNLLQSYMDHLGKEARIVEQGPNDGRYLVEAERPEEKLPIYEDENGTHVMSADDIALLEVLPELLRAQVDSLYIETLLKPEAYNEAVIRLYRQAMEAWERDPDGYECDEEWLDALHAQQPEGRELGFGFLYKEQVY